LLIHQGFIESFADRILFISNRGAIRQKVFLHNHRRKVKKQSISQIFAHKIEAISAKKCKFVRNKKKTLVKV
jgi:hypothetical protein